MKAVSMQAEVSNDCFVLNTGLDYNSRVWAFILIKLSVHTRFTYVEYLQVLFVSFFLFSRAYWHLDHTFVLICQGTCLDFNATNVRYLRFKLNIAFFNRMVGLAYLAVRTREFLFVIVKVSFYYLDFFVLRHWWVLQVPTPRHIIRGRIYII